MTSGIATKPSVLVAMVSFAVLFALALPAPAQTIPSIASVSDQVAAKHPDLAQQRTVLVEERNKLRERTQQHNTQCSAVEEGSAAAASCLAEREKLNSDLAAHISRTNRFNDVVRAAQSESAVGPLTPLKLARSPVVLDELLGLESTYLQSHVPAQRLVSSDLLRWVRAECQQSDNNDPLRRQLYQLATAELQRRGELPGSEYLESPPKPGTPTGTWPGLHSTEPPLPNPLTTRTKEDQVGPTLDRLRKIFRGDPFMDALLAAQGANP